MTAADRARGALGRARGAVVAARLEPRLVWILGSARSGTTWLANLVGGLTGSRLLDEPLIGAHLAVPVGAVTSLARTDDPLLHEANADRADYVFAESARGAWEPALRSLLLRRFAVGTGRDGFVIVKEPNGSLAAPMLLRALPRSRLLFLVRDGRDVVDSMVDGAAGGWIAETHGAALDDAGRASFIEQRARAWVRTVEAVEAAYDAHDPARRIRLTYEGLLADTEAEVARVLRWLGREDALPAVAEGVARLSFERVPAEQKGSGRFVRAASPGLWRERFSADEQALLQEIMGPALGRLGYA